MDNPLSKLTDLKRTTPSTTENDRIWFDNLLDEAILRRASDIHIEPRKGKSVMRLRVDGMLHVLDEFEKELHGNIISQIKVISDLDIANTHFPQDGQFEYVYDERSHYIRVSTFPTIYGETVVMRILNRKDALLGLDQLGFDEKQLTDLRRIIIKPFGMILTTGPSGSGKSTLLNSILNELNTTENNIITIEDPVEFHIDGVRQTQVNQYHEFNFTTALRAILRQDPDIIMIGEIRDAETAQIAIQATLTGRRFFSTFHTLDVFAIISRFIEMGISKTVIAYALGGVISARLVRKIHEKCKVPYVVKDSEMRILHELLPADRPLFEGEGCEECSNTGYFGTTGIFEVVSFDEEIRNTIIESTSLELLRPVLKAKNIKSLLGSAIDKVTQGTTTLAEVIRVTGGGDKST